MRDGWHCLMVVLSCHEVVSWIMTNMERMILDSRRERDEWVAGNGIGGEFNPAFWRLEFGWLEVTQFPLKGAEKRIVICSSALITP